MITRRRSSSRTFLNLLILGVFAGFAVFLWIQFSEDGGDNAADVRTPTTVAVQPTVPGAGAAATTETLPDANPGPTTTPMIEPDMAISPSAQIIIPSAAINAQVVETYLDGTSWDVSSLGMNVGHLQGTRWLTDAPGNIVLSGHVEMRDGRKGVFANLGELQEGALVILREDDIEKRYVVREISTVEPNNLSPVRPTTSERLTLITCGDYDFLRDAYLERTVVVAEPVS